MSAVMAALVDVNVLVALLHARHRHSARAVQWLDQQREPASVLVCRVAQMGALRLLTHPSVMKEDVLSAGGFWKGWKQLMSDDRFAHATEPSGFESAWREITTPFPKGRCAETDAWFAAFARAGNWVLTTFDRGLRRFPDVRVEILA